MTDEQLERVRELASSGVSKSPLGLTNSVLFPEDQEALCAFLEQRDRLREALEFYGYRCNYEHKHGDAPKIDDDRGERARAALHPEEPTG